MIQTSPFATLRRILLSTLLLPLAAGSAPLPFAQIHARPSLSQPHVSPDGKRIALCAESDGLQYLALMDTVTLQISLQAKFEDVKVHEFTWVGNKLLLAILEGSNGHEIRSFDLETGKIASMSPQLRGQGISVLGYPENQPEDIIVQVNTRHGVFNRGGGVFDETLLLCTMETN